MILPRFQRGYSWEKSQVSTFWSDLVGFEKLYSANPVSASYFLGPIVTQESDTEIVLLDGQQRLATATIFLAVLRNVARTLDQPGEHRGADFARDIQAELIEKEGKSASYALRLGELDQEFFQKNIQEDSSKFGLKPTLRSHKNILSAYKYLYDSVTQLIHAKLSSDALDVLSSFKKCLVTGLTMVAIKVQAEEDAYRIFETLNDRGLRLSVPDLLLNLLMRRAADDAQRTLVRQKWNYMLGQMGRRDISRFLRHMWLSKYGDLKARGLFSEIKEYVESNAADSLDFAQTCSDECDDYISLIDLKNIPRPSIRDVSGVVKYLDISSALPLLLSGRRCLNESDFAKLANAVIGLSIRYSVVANLNPANLETAFYEAARVIRGKKSTGDSSSRCLSAARKILAKLNPDDAIVEAKARELELTRSQAVWLLTALANSKQSKTKEIAVDDANLEHVYPQNPDPSEWPNRSTLEPLLWHLGNLTVLGTKLNRKAANKGFIRKRDSYYRTSEIKLTQDLVISTKWEPSDVQKRAGTLAVLMTKVWPGP